MGSFTVEVSIENKPAARDPEGESIQRDLISKGGYSAVKAVRVGKLLRLKVEAQSGEAAQGIAFDLCDKLRIYNPVVHTCKIEVKEASP